MEKDAALASVIMLQGERMMASKPKMRSDNIPFESHPKHIYKKMVKEG